MSQKQTKFTISNIDDNNPEDTLQNRVQNYLYHEMVSPCLLLHTLIAVKLMQQGNRDILDMLPELEAAMSSTKNMKELSGAGYESDIALLLALSSNKTSTQPRDIVEYFENLSVREKLLINAASEIGCLSSSIPGDGDNLDSRIQDAITVDPADVPNDPECQWLLGIQQLASNASR